MIERGRRKERAGEREKREREKREKKKGEEKEREREGRERGGERFKHEKTFGVHCIKF